MGRPRRTAGILLIAVSLLVIGVAIAQAGKGVESQFGTFGGAEGQFDSPRGPAVNAGTGDVYVADMGNQRIQQFDADGGFVRTWGWGVLNGSGESQVCTTACLPGTAGSDAGAFNFPQGVAVNQSTGDLYVTDRDNNRVQQFDADGDFVRAWGWGVQDGSDAFQVCAAPGPCQIGIAGSGDGQLGATGAVNQLAVDQASGDLYVTDPGNGRVQRFSSSGAFEIVFGASGAADGEFGADSPTRVATDSTGDVYVVDPGNARIQRFDATGAFEATFADAELAGEPAPVDLAVDTGNDHVYVVKPCTETLCADAPAVSDERRILELDASGTVVDTHMANAGVNDTNGIALNTASGRIYVSTTSGDHQIHVLDDILAPTVTVSVASVTAHTATVEGTVNPQGSLTNYRFEYSANGVDWTPVTPSDIAAGAGTSDVPVSAVITSLAASTEYQVRLVATKPFGNPGATSTPETFETAAAAPLVETATTTASKDGVVLRARINPEGLATSYRFELGLDTGYGTTAPIPDADAGAGGEWVVVEQPIEDLDENTTYHYRVVATNAEGSTTGPDRTVTTGEGLPVDRAYERVSPAAKNGSDVLMESSRTRAAATGDAIQFASLGAFGDTLGTGIATEYVSERTDDGWVTHGITPLQDAQDQDDAAFGFDPRIMGELSPDLATGVYMSKTALAPGTENAAGLAQLFVRRDLTDAGPGTYELISQASSPVTGPDSYVPFPAGASADFSHVIFTSSLNLTGETVGNTNKLFEWVEGSGVRLAGVLPDGGGPAPRSIAGQGAAISVYTPNTISRDGRRIFFTVGAGNFSRSGELYVREDGTTTTQINVTEKTGTADDVEPATYWDASADGSIVFFTTAEQLTDDDNNSDSDLYRADLAAAEGSRLTRLSVDMEPADGTTTSVDTVLGASADGEYVYFTSLLRLTPGSPPVPSSGLHVYVWHDGGLAFVGAVSDRDTSDNTPNAWTLNRKMARVTPDGTHLAFVSRSPGATGYDPGSCDGGEPCRQVYLYSAEANEGAGSLVCASCRPDGQPSTGHGVTMTRSATGGSPAASHLSTAIADDGSRVFFSTTEALVTEDRNGAGSDAYVYDVASGQVRLISRGTGGNSFFMDASRDGDDVFFTTRERLVGSDVDDNVDLYTARVGGGFDEPAPAPQPCAGASCRGAAPVPPGSIEPGSSSFFGPEGSPLDVLPFFHADRLGARQLRRLAAGRRATLSVRVSEAGRVSARVRGRVGGRSRLIDTASKVARGQGLVRLRLQLSNRARAQLLDRGRLRISIAVRYGPAIATQRLNVTLVRGGDR